MFSLGSLAQEAHSQSAISNHEESIFRFAPIQIQGNPSQRLYTREQIENRAGGNRDLPTLISDHPAIRQGSTVAAAENRGSLELADISFYGSSPYQNQFTIDGAPASNQLDPATRFLGLRFGSVPGYAQIYNLDTALLENVRVLDSYIPVEHGRFTGGVIDARTRNPTGTNTFSVAYSHNNSRLTRQMVSSDVQATFDQGAPGYTPKWNKHFVSVTSDLALAERSNAALSMSRRLSGISRAALTHRDGETALLMSNHKDQVDNFFAKLHTQWNTNVASSLILKYSDRREMLSSARYRDTDWRHQQRAYGMGWHLGHEGSWGQLSMQIGADNMRNARSSDQTTLINHQFAGRTAMQYTQGGMGTESTRQINLTAKARVDFHPQNTGPIEHQTYAGLELSSVRAAFVRDHDLLSYRAMHYADGTERHFPKTQFKAGRINVNYDSMSLYMADRMQWKRLALSAGLRMDRDDYYRNTNTAPRTRLDWDTWGNGQTVVSMGWARYYGLDMLGIAMAERKKWLQHQLIDARGREVVDGQKRIEYRVAGLRSPYDDEWAVTLTQRIGLLRASLQYVHRNGRNQITREGSDATGYRYANRGQSETDSISLSLSPTTDLVWKESRWTGRMDLSYQQARRSTNLVAGYESRFDDPDEIISYNGKRIRRGDRPAAQFNLPGRASLGLTGSWPGVGLMLDNRVNWLSRREDIFYLGIQDALPTYVSGKVPSHWTWDASLNWSPTMARGLTMSISALNILDRQAPLVATNPAAMDNRKRYRSGRELWVGLQYKV